MPRGVDVWDEANLQGRLWTPAQWRGTLKLTAWFDAQTSPITIATGVSQWNDLSGNGRHATRSGTTTQPLWQGAGWAGNECMPCIKPDGTDDYLDVSLPTPGWAGLSFHVAAFNPNSGSKSLGSCVTTSGGPQLRFSGSSVNILKNGVTNLLTSTATAVGYSVVGMDLRTSLTRAWINGTMEQNTTDPALTQPMNGFFRNNTAGEYMNSPVGEIIYSNITLTTDEATVLIGYLAWKWGTVDKLPAGHRFKLRPPLIGAL